MSALINLLSDGCVDFEKCGDVVVSPKDNMIGVFCHFCSDIFRSLLEFLHHLQDAHNDVLSFPSPHNVYTVEQLLSLPERSPPVQSQDVQTQANCSNSSCDSGVPADAISASGVDSVRALSENIMNALAAYDVQCDKEHILEDPARQEEQLTHIKDKHDVVPKTTQTPINSTDCQIKNTEKNIQTTKAKRTNRTQEAGNRNKSIKKSQPLCNPKSYAIARSARKREQQQRLSTIKRRIIRSLENDEVKLIRKPFQEQQINELQKFLPNNQLKITKLKPIASTKGAKKNNFMILQKENSNKGNIAKPFEKDVDVPSNNLSLNSPKSNIVEMPIKSNQTNIKRTISSPIIINQIEYLPKLTLNLGKSQSIELSSLEHTVKWNNVAKQMEKSANEMLKQPRRRSSITGISSPPMVAKKPARRPSYSAPNSQQAQMQSAQPELKRKQLTMNISETVEEKRRKPEDSSPISPSFDLSESVVEFLQTDLKTSQLDADSLLRLADPKMERNSDPFESEINQVERDEKFQKMAEDANKIEANSTVRANVRDDLTLLQLVGLPIIKDPNIEDHKPVEYSEELRSRASNFSQMLKEHNTVWNPHRFNGQFYHKFRKELQQLTKEVNDKFKANINVSELKRILNLLNAWHVQKIIQKDFKKVALSTTIEYYLLLFGFIPRTKKCLYYCEWCEEIHYNKSRYEKHRMIHESNFFCPHCKRGFKLRGKLISHILSTHG